MFQMILLNIHNNKLKIILEKTLHQIKLNYMCLKNFYNF